MGRRSIIQAAIFIVFLGCLSSGLAQLDTSDEFGTSSFGLRRLSAYYARNFATQFPVTCYKSSYFSPFRTYFKDIVFVPLNKITVFVFQLNVSACPYPKSECCRLYLDHMVIRTKPSAKVLSVRLNGQPMNFDVGKEGLTIYRMRVDPTIMTRTYQLEITTPEDGYQYVENLCPMGRYPSSCDIISYDESRTCCPERSAFPISLVDPNPMPPTSITETTFAPPRMPPTYPPPPLHPSPPPSPPPPSPLPPSPPPPPPDGWDQCCVDDVTKAPFNLKYQGYKRTGSDTAYLFQLIFRNNSIEADNDGLEKGDCSTMNLRDLGVSILDGLIVRSVLFNGTVVDYWLEPAARVSEANWLYFKVLQPYTAFSEEFPLDVVITVRGKVDALCPANDYLHSTQACEFVMHGRDGETQCCPHGATRRAGPFDDCCVDDIEKSPYRMNYYSTNYSRTTTVFDFGIQVVPVTNIDLDLEENAFCDHMTLDSAQIQIYKHVEVVQVKWEDRIMDFNITPATDYANWLNINGINRFINDFNPSMPTKFKVFVKGPVRELCPAGWLLDAGGATLCEYALHGVQGNATCCPHDITAYQSEGRGCGCRDDLPGTPYRLGYSLSARDSNHTMFNFDLAKIDPNKAQDFDGAPDLQFGAPVSCTDMAIKDIVLVVRKDLQIQDVIFNGFNYTWQVEPYTDGANWLRILDLYYKPSDLPTNKAVPLQVLVRGGEVSELCTASSLYGSQSSCEFIIYGLSGADECCPNGVTSWSVPSLLLGATR